MNQLFARHSSILALALAFAAASAQAMPSTAQAPESGRWITQSGNLEIEIAPCGAALCGTVVRVVSNGSMSGPEAPAPVPSALGMKILFDLRPLANGGFQGRIYNRGDKKTYNSLVSIAKPNELKLTIYEDTPAKSQAQIWRRAGSAE